MTSKTTLILQRMGLSVALYPLQQMVLLSDDDGNNDFKTIAIILFVSWLILKWLHFALISKYVSWYRNLG